MRQTLDRRIRLYALRGSLVHCWCCGSNFVTFLPGGVQEKRANALCPRCGSLERHRLLWNYLKSKTNLFKNNIRLLHVAPESLFYTIFSTYPTIEYVPCARFGEGYTDVYPAGTYDKDITDLKDADDTYDVILCSHVLEHIPDDGQAMRELRRVLKPDGWAVLQVPLDSSRATTYEDFSITDPKEREKAFGQHDHVRVYGNDYEDRLVRAGFQVKRDKGAYQYSSAELFKYGLIPEDIFICTK